MRALDYPALVAKGIVKCRSTLARLIETQGFPAGFLIAPNSRRWDEADVDEWLAARPTARKPAPRRPYREKIEDIARPVSDARQFQTVTE